MLRLLAAGLIGTLWGVPLLLGLLFALPPALDASAWQAVFSYKQLLPAIALSLSTGTAALLISLALALLIVASIHDTPQWKRLTQANAVFLSIPHLAFAIGLAFLIMPAGWIARVLALFTGAATPPSWITQQDPWGLSLVLVLVCKETPFLIWAISSLISRGDIALAFQGQWRSARSLGHGPRSIWLRVFVPQILARLKWPLAIVWVYGATVVDVALVIGPTQPPTYAVTSWADLNDAEIATNDRGAAGTLLLTAVLGFIAIAAFAAIRAVRPLAIRYLTKGPLLRKGAESLHGAAGVSLFGLIAILYVMVLVTLLIMSVAGYWPFPALLPEEYLLKGWAMLLGSPESFLNSLWLAVLTAAAALAIAVLWLELMPAELDAILGGLALMALVIPQITLVAGQYALFLRLGLAGTATGVFLAHLTPVLAYVLIVLIGPYRAFDRRYRSASLGLNCSAWRFWNEVKRPLMMPALTSAAAVGFSVSLVQFLPAQLVGAGRISTLPVEAVTLASGGSRTTLAAFAIGLTVPAAIGFYLAQRVSRPKWSAA